MRSIAVVTKSAGARRSAAPARVMLRALLALFVALVTLTCSTEHPRAVDSDVAADVVDVGPPPLLPEPASAPVVLASLAVSPAPAAKATAETAAPVATAAVSAEPTPLAVCLAAAYALNPEWDPKICTRMQDDTDPANPRKARCERQRAPLQKFAEAVCATVVEETTREGLDLLLPLAVIERESSGGRVAYNGSLKIFQVETDICEWFLSAHRIVSREPGTREGTEVLVWTYGDDARTNRQAVRVTGDEMPRGLRINTCVAGEAGIMQLVPREWKSGTVVEATGEVLRGTTEERRLRVEGDPVLQIRIGCQALVEHRDLWPEAARNPWWSWISAYNLGTTTRGEHACGYQRKLLRHYLDACQGYIPDPAGGLPTRLIDAWPGCAAAQQAYDNWAFCEAYKPADE